MDITFSFHFSWSEIFGAVLAVVALVAWVLRSGGGGEKQ